MQTFRILLMILIVPLFLQGCGKSKGEKIADEVCSCYEAAKSNPAGMASCVGKQVQLQTEIQGDQAETLKYLQKFSECKFAK